MSYMANTLYLDTNFISEFSKADIGFEDTPNYNLLSELLSLIREGCHSGFLKCVTSQLSMLEIQSLESSPVLFLHAKSLINELCSSHYLKSWENILVHQTAVQLLKYLKIEDDITNDWTAFTNKQPDMLPGKLVEQTKNGFKDTIGEIVGKKYSEADFNTIYEIEKNSILNETFRQPILRYLSIPTFSQIFETYIYSLIKESRISPGEFDLVKILEFLNSPLINEIPYIYIFCSINTSIRINEKSRNYKPGDLFDVPILASAIPYCDIVTTDKTMKSHVTNRLHLDSKYTADFFSLSKSDLQALLEIVRNKLI